MRRVWTCAARSTPKVPEAVPSSWTRRTPTPPASTGSVPTRASPSGPRGWWRRAGPWRASGARSTRRCCGGGSVGSSRARGTAAGTPRPRSPSARPRGVAPCRGISGATSHRPPGRGNRLPPRTARHHRHSTSRPMPPAPQAPASGHGSEPGRSRRTRPCQDHVEGRGPGQSDQPTYDQEQHHQSPYDQERHDQPPTGRQPEDRQPRQRHARQRNTQHQAGALDEGGTVEEARS